MMGWELGESGVNEHRKLAILEEQIFKKNVA